MNTRDFLPTQITEFEEPADPQFEAAADLEDIARHLDLEPWITQRLLHSERELTTNLVISREDGTPLTFTGYRVQHLTSRGPTLGRVAFSPHVSLAGIRAAAMEATWQAALLNLPFGGAAGAIICNPDELTEKDLRQLSREFAHALRGMIGRFQDVLAPGLGCHTQMIAWMVDRISRDEGRLEPGAATGKPESMYGLPDYTGMTMRGIVTLIEHLLASGMLKGLTSSAGSQRGPLEQPSVPGLRVSVQGFGSLGASLASSLYDLGAKIVAVADISGGLHNADGIDIPALAEYASGEKLIFGFTGAEAVGNADVLEADCDILIMAAAEHQLTVANAGRIKARMIVEAAKRAITSGAEEILESRGSVVVPEILATAGGAIAAFLEWNQSARYSALSAAEAHIELAKRLHAGFDAAASIAEKNRSSLREAAHTIAIDRIASEMRIRK